MAVIKSSNLDRNRDRSLGVIGAGPPVTAPPCRNSSIRSRVASVAPISASVNARPRGSRTRAPAAKQRAASGMSAVMTISPAPLSRRSNHRPRKSQANDHFHEWSNRRPQRRVGDDFDREAVSTGDSIDFVLNRAGIGVHVNSQHVRDSWLNLWRTTHSYPTLASGVARPAARMCPFVQRPINCAASENLS